MVELTMSLRPPTSSYEQILHGAKPIYDPGGLIRSTTSYEQIYTWEKIKHHPSKCVTWSLIINIYECLHVACGM